MRPGRELDALVAEKVMGYRRNSDDRYGERPFIRPGGVVVLADFLATVPSLKLPKFSTDIAAANQVLEKMITQGCHGGIDFNGGLGDHCVLVWLSKNPDQKFSRDCAFDRIPWAICLVSLFVLGAIEDV